MSYRDERHDGSLQSLRLADPGRAYGERLGITWSADRMRARLPDADLRLELFAARTDFDRDLYRRIMSSSEEWPDHAGYCDSLPPGGTRRTPYRLDDVWIGNFDGPLPQPGEFRDGNREEIRAAFTALATISLPEVRVRTGGFEGPIDGLVGPAMLIDSAVYEEPEQPMFPWYTWNFPDPWGCIGLQAATIANSFSLSADEALEVVLMTTLGARGGDAEFPVMVSGGKLTDFARAAIAVHEALGPDPGLFRSP